MGGVGGMVEDGIKGASLLFFNKVGWLKVNTGSYSGGTGRSVTLALFFFFFFNLSMPFFSGLSFRHTNVILKI